MRLLLTSMGVTNPSIADALVRLLGKPIELTALPTIREESWVPAVRDADALLVGGRRCALPGRRTVEVVSEGR